MNALIYDIIFYKPNTYIYEMIFYKFSINNIKFYKSSTLVVSADGLIKLCVIGNNYTNMQRSPGSVQ